MNLPEPMTPSAEAFAGLHEMYLGALAGGFTEAQAMQIICAFFVASLPQQRGNA